MLCVALAVVLFVAGAAAAEGRPITATVQFEIGESLASAYWLASLRDEAATEEPVLALTWAPVPVGWFGGVWGIQVVSNRGLLPVGSADPGAGELAGTSMMNIVHADPRPGHRYEAVLSYDPPSGAAAVRVTDLTLDETVAEAGLQLAPYAAPVTLADATLESATQHVRVEFTPLGIDWRLVQLTEAGQRVAADPVDRRLPVLVSTRVPWEDVAGGLRLTLFPLDAAPDAVVRQMGTVPLVNDGLQPLSFAAVAPGQYEARVEYVSTDGTVTVPVGSTVLRVGVVTARVEGARAQLLANYEVGWQGELVVSADGPVPDVTVQVEATLDKWFLDAASPVNQRAIGTVRDGQTIALEHRFAVLDEEEQRLPLTVRLPISLDVEWPYRIWDAGLQPEVTSVAGAKTGNFSATLRAYADRRPEPGPTVRVMTYNIQHGEGMDERIDLQRLADVIALADADVVGLQEVDVRTRRAGGVDQLQVLADLLRMEAMYGPAIPYQGGQYGNAVLSRHPITRYQNVPLPNFGNERRGQLETTIDIGGTPLWFTVTHTSLIAEENAAQRQFLVDRLRRVEEPFVLVGDFNMRGEMHADPRTMLDPLVRDAWLTAVQMSEPGSRLRVTNSAGYTFNASNPSRRIDYIFLSDELELPDAGAVFTINTQASDHLPLVAELVWPPRN